jgi:hypothetical protein
MTRSRAHPWLAEGCRALTGGVFENDIALSIDAGNLTGRFIKDCMVSAPIDDASAAALTGLRHGGDIAPIGLDHSLISLP